MPKNYSEEQRLASFSQKHSLSHRLKNGLMTHARSWASPLLTRVRVGPEKVIMIPLVARGGNWLYEWMKASTETAQTGQSVKVAERPGMTDWLNEFPELAKITIPPQNIRWRSKRDLGANFDIEGDFTPAERQHFIEKVLLSSSKFAQRRESARRAFSDNPLIINIRRGDYYSHPVIHQNFGIDTVAYVKEAASQCLKIHLPQQIVVVSDDLPWCAENLSFLQEFAPTKFDKFGNSMFDDLAVLSIAKYLILTNTTFGYWGGYIASLMEDATVWVPDIHERHGREGDHPVQHLASWIPVFPPTNSWLETDC